MILKKGLQLGDTLLAVYDGSAESRHGIRLALSIAEKNKGEIVILILRNSRKAQDQREGKFEDELEKLSHDITVKLIKQPRPDSLAYVPNTLQGGAVYYS